MNKLVSCCSMCYIPSQQSYDQEENYTLPDDDEPPPAPESDIVNILKKALADRNTSSSSHSKHPKSKRRVVKPPIDSDSGWFSIHGMCQTYRALIV